MKVLVLALFLTVCIASVSAQYTAAQLKANDILVLNYALTLERLESTFYTTFQAHYTAANFTAAGYPAGTYEYLNLIRDHEQAHVTSLSQAIIALGGTPVAACPSYNFSSVTSVQTYIGLARVFENTGVSAYDGAVQTINDKTLLTTAATIATIEGRHASFLGNLSAMSPFPNTRDDATPPLTVVGIVAPFLGPNCPAPALPAILVQLPNFSNLFDGNGTFIAANASAYATTLSNNDVNVLKFAFFLEQLEAAFYTEFLNKYNTSASFGAYGAGVFSYVTLIKEHEVAHVSYLASVLSGLSVPVPNSCNFNFSVDGPLNSVTAYLGLAQTFENVGVTAYDGAIAAITAKPYAEAAATIATVEARHAAYLNLITGRAPAIPTAPLDTAANPLDIVNTVAKYLLQPCPAPTLPHYYVLTPSNSTATATTSTSSTGATGTTGPTTGGSTGGSTGATGTTSSTGATGSTTATGSNTGSGSGSSTTSAGVAVVASSGLFVVLLSVFALLI